MLCSLCFLLLIHLPLQGNNPARGFRVLARALCVAIAWLTPVCGLRAQDPGWLVRNWQTEHGLPDSCVTAVAQTPDGYLWVGTPKGLARFDGLQFKVFDARQVPALGAGWISALLTDRRGVLWIATGSGQLLGYENGRFQAAGTAGPVAPEPTVGYLRDDSGKSLPLSALRQATLAEDAAGAVWMLSGAGGLVSCVAGKVTRHGGADGLPADRVDGLCADDAGVVWVVAGETLFRRTADRWQQLEGVAGPHGQLAPLLAAARPGGVWVVAPRGSMIDGGRRVRRLAEDGWCQELEPAPWIANSMRSEVTALHVDRAGRVWLGMLWNGLWYAADGGPWQRLQDAGSLSQCVINCLFEDRHGALWVGSDREGLHRLSRRPVVVVTLPEVARENIITASCATRDGSIWVGTDGAGAFRLTAGNFAPFGQKEGLDAPHVCSILEDREGRLWFGTWGGLFQFSDGRFARVAGPPALGQAVLALFEDRAGRLWAGSQGGLVCCDHGAWTVRRLLDGGVSMDIRALAEDAAGALWVGTVGQGLIRLDGDRVSQFRCSGGFPAADARSLWCDPASGALWIGTMNQGLIRWENGGFTAYGIADGLPSDTIGCIVPDDAGNLWLGSDNGIFACPLRVLADYRRGTSPALAGAHLTRAEGLVSRACSGSGQPVPCRTADGRFWFPNYRGLVGFDPARVTARGELPDLRVEAVVVDGKERTAAEALQVSSSARRFEFHYTVPELVTPQGLRFRYQLVGMDPGWVNAGNQRVAAYSQLPPGEYEFQVMAGGADGCWHSAAAPWRLKVVPRFWELRWLQLVFGMVLVGGIAGLILLNQRGKHRRRLARIQQARALEQERQRIAANIHDDLGASLTRITLLSDLARVRAEAGGIGAELEQIHSTSRALTKAMDEVVWAIAPEHDSLDSLVTYLGKIAQDLLRAAGVRCRLEIPATLPDIGLTGQVRHGLLLAAKEALHNVVKHAAASEARVLASLHEGRFELVVTDNGRGFDPAQVPVSGRPGRGLRNMVGRLKEMGGICAVTSTPGTGTEIRFSVPLETHRHHQN